MARKSAQSSTLTTENIGATLDGLQIELPSWGFADAGTRFDKFLQPAARTIEEKFSDAGQVHRFTGTCPTVALHVLWDLPEGTKTSDVKKVAERYGFVRARSVPMSSKIRVISMGRSRMSKPPSGSAGENVTAAGVARGITAHTLAVEAKVAAIGTYKGKLLTRGDLLLVLESHQ